MTVPEAKQAVRRYLSALSSDVSHDAHGLQSPAPEELYTPIAHQGALDPSVPLVVGSRGAGKSFWSGVLLSPSLRAEAAQAYPRLGLDRVVACVGFSGLAGAGGVDREKLDACVPPNAEPAQARAFWWATILQAVNACAGAGGVVQPTSVFLQLAQNVPARDATLDGIEKILTKSNSHLVVVYDALDGIATDWPRRRMLTQALLEVVWAMRAYRTVRPKLFLRPDQLEDDGLRFVELPKLRAGAVPLRWSTRDLYGLLYTRICLGECGEAFSVLSEDARPIAEIRTGVRDADWAPRRDTTAQKELMDHLSGPYMATGPHGRKKGVTYDWPMKHLADADGEVTPRSFLTLLVTAAKDEASPDLVIPPEGMRLAGLRAASKVRVDQLYEEFPWIKGVLAPLAGLLLPLDEEGVFKVWRAAKTVEMTNRDVEKRGYLSPFPNRADEAGLFAAMQRISVMERRADGRLDMPDLFRVAARLLKKGSTAPG